MKEKHLAALQKQHQQNLQRGVQPKPSMHSHARLALVNGERLTVRPGADLIREAKRRIAEERYGSVSFGLEDVFKSCPSFDKQLREWKAAEATRQKKVKAYRKVAEKILRKAEFDDAADPAECAEQLHVAAAEAGL